MSGLKIGSWNITRGVVQLVGCDHLWIYTVKKYPYIDGRFVASFRILTQPVPYTFVSVNRRNNEAQALVAVCACSSLFRRFTDTNVYRTGSVKIWIKPDRSLTGDTLNAPWLLTNRQFQWTGNGHSQLPLAELGKPSSNIDLLRTTGSNGRA